MLGGREDVEDEVHHLGQQVFVIVLAAQTNADLRQGAQTALYIGGRDTVLVQIGLEQPQGLLGVDGHAQIGLRIFRADHHQRGAAGPPLRRALSGDQRQIEGLFVAAADLGIPRTAGRHILRGNGGRPKAQMHPAQLQVTAFPQGIERLRRQRARIQQGAIGRIKILDHIIAVTPYDARMAAADAAVRQADVAIEIGRISFATPDQRFIEKGETLTGQGAIEHLQGGRMEGIGDCHEISIIKSDIQPRIRKSAPRLSPWCRYGVY